MNMWVESSYPFYWRQVKQIPCLPEFLLTCSIDMLLQPLFLAETRFMMQNRFSNFAVYHSLMDVFRLSPIEIYRGVTMNIPRNFFISLCKSIM